MTIGEISGLVVNKFDGNFKKIKEEAERMLVIATVDHDKHSFVKAYCYACALLLQDCLTATHMMAMAMNGLYRLKLSIKGIERAINTEARAIRKETMTKRSK